jgi:hypothetical protein
LQKEVVSFVAKKRKRIRTARVANGKKKSKLSKWIWLFIVGQFAGYIVIFSLLDYRPPVAISATNGIFITAAHLTEKDVGARYKLLYSNPTSDIAYYLDNEYKGPVQALQNVRIKGLTGATIIDSSSGKFKVKVTDAQQIVGGLSGERVYDSTGVRVLGFVSAMLPGGVLSCLAIE